MALLPVVASAYDACIDGIYYNFSGDEAEVTYSRPRGNGYSGDIVIPETITYEGNSYRVTSIGSQGFAYCYEVTSVTIPNGLLSIGDNAFCKCLTLQSVNIPEGITDIGKTAFWYCVSLTSITIPGSVKSIGKAAFKDCYNLTSITLSNGVTTIGEEAFKECTSLCSINIPESVTSIGGSAFLDCMELTELTLPNSLTSIGDLAFANDKLANVYCYAEEVPNAGIGSFSSNNYVSVVLHVPAGSADKYRTTYPWSEFRNIVPMITVQDEDYIPLLADGKVWIYKEKDLLGYYPDHSEWDKIYSLEGDTVIDSHQCLKLYLTCQSPYEPYNHSFKGAMFEEGEKVYYIESGSTTPYLLYDFSINTGIIQVRTCRLRINDIKLTKYRGKYLRVIHWRNLEYDADGSGLWIEGVGGLIDLQNSFSIGNSITQSELITCKVNDQIIYDRDEFMESALTDPVTFTKDQMATIILPTAPDASKGKYYKLDRREDGQIVFIQETQLQARTPYIIVPNEDFSIDMSTLDMAGLSPDTVTVGGISFIGSYVRTELPTLTGEDGGGSSFSYYDIIDTTPDCQSDQLTPETFTIGALRAYLVVTWDDPIHQGPTKGEPEKLEIVLLEEGTGIGDAERLNDKGQMINDNSVYDLSGRRIGNGKWIIDNGKLKSGIYVVGGKKVQKPGF